MLTAVFEVDGIIRKNLLLYQGVDQPISAWVKYENGKPVDLTGATEIKIKMQKDTGLLELDGTIAIQAGGGRLDTEISAADATLLKDGERKDVEISYIKDSKAIAFILEEVLEVKERFS